MNKEDIQAEAYRLGFCFAGVSLPGTPLHYFEYTAWLEKGRAAGMAYLDAPYARDARRQPGKMLPGARSILSLGVNYPLPAGEEPGPGMGRISAYAGGEDYHRILPGRLDELARCLQRLTHMPLEYRACTDTSPVLERETASAGGLGWIGKNTCLIHPREGSCFFLAELFLNIEIQPDEPFSADRCGNCRKCISACPTGCILPDRTLDAGRCLSYLTIENKGIIPQDLRPAVGSRVFGCDLCQMVCPWNRRLADRPRATLFTPDPALIFPDLLEELNLTPQLFNQKFKATPVQRAKRRGYLRNVCVALGNQKDPRAVPRLIEVLEQEPEPLVRGHSAWALGQIGTSGALSALEKALNRETDPVVREEITDAIAIL